jgi:hypothetical protein
MAGPLRYAGPVFEEQVRNPEMGIGCDGMCSGGEGKIVSVWSPLAVWETGIGEKGETVRKTKI